MATKKAKITKEMLISLYMESVLENGKAPKSIYHFAKENNFEEADFYAFFGNFERVEKEIFLQFYQNTLNLLEANQAYLEYGTKEKMLSFYFTFFELLAANRSYVVLALKLHHNPLKNLVPLTLLREQFKEYTASILTDEYRIATQKLQNVQDKAIQESAWLQLLFTIKFWLEDDSPAFEKTDILIEKAVNTTFELMRVAPVNQLLDLGKFLFKEKFQSKF
ncbi:TetR family transcriptional regulator C-terminal domain-containing protein [Flavobacterium agrisoli]|uniref:TetR/AcrR family transcriptional regulator n=1 Tax=Flavobacterium agrisoli TaxID=2793066 RepID=A0A934PQH9_9FLAO|nr:TetR family transcriptional regulator C-terminal domain-containing protein [Flavobacterium agrisoli]MBK0371225.1 TetR/AcrR family transcriptional regulator [Flavobacterium agrisoli]